MTPHADLASRGSAVEESVLSPAISPAGRLYLEHRPGPAALSPAVAHRIERAFERGEGGALLHLGTVELATDLPADLAWFREIARAFLARLCAIPDLDAARQRVVVPSDDDVLDRLAASPPPITGAEYLGRAALEALWRSLEAAVRDELAALEGSVQAWLEKKSPAWNLVGRVCFHLAENRRDPDHPFAFLATYSPRVSARGKAQHVPLGRALEEYAGDKDALLALLRPVKRAAEASPFVRALVDSGDVYRPLAWTPTGAHRFLVEVPLLESSGVIVRIPDWWRTRRPPRPEVRVTVGETTETIGFDALLSFRVDLTIEGEALTREEWESLRAAAAGLVFVKGRWVEVDREKLDAVLHHFREVERAAGRDGIDFIEGMRLLAGVSLGEKDEGAAERPAWSRVVAGAGLRRALDELASPDALDPGPALATALRPYQKVGLSWLRRIERLGLGGCLADDMGLGKTIQVLALLLLLQREKRGPSLLVVPASLVANWKAEAERFAPSLRLLIAHPSETGDLAKLGASEIAAADVVVTTYGALQRCPAVARARWELVVLDEAQAIKNPSTKQTRAVKALSGRARLALTGTPVENRLADLWSIFDFLCPGLLGSQKEFAAFARRLAERETAPQLASEAERWSPLRALVRPYILRRLKTDESVIQDLPDKTELRAFCGLGRKQAALYQQSVEELARGLATKDGIERRGMILAFLLRLKQICNHPSQWLGDGSWDPADSGKLARVRELCEPIAARQEKVLVFTQFRETTGPLARFLEGVFGRPGLVLHGQTAVKERRALVEAFQDERGRPFFVLSLKAGGTGLNLTAASHVIHFDRWWNPAVEDQATDRAFRIGQKKNVLVHKLVCRGTVEEKVDAMIESKRALASSVVEGGGEVPLTELGNDELLRLVALDIHAATQEG